MTTILSPSPSQHAYPNNYSMSQSPRQRRRECLGLVTSMRMSMDLSMKAVSVVLCCVMMTLPNASFHKGKRKPLSEDMEPPHKRARTSPSTPSSSTSTSTSTTSSSTLPHEYFLCCHYRTLMIESDAELADIKKAHRKMAVKYHPDKNQDSSSQEMFIRIQEAYETLSDETKRSLYDTKMHHHIHQHHSTPLTCNDSCDDQPAYDIFGSSGNKHQQNKKQERRSRVARYFFNNQAATTNNKNASTSTSILPIAPLSSWIFMFLCISLFMIVVIPSFIVMLCSGMLLSISTATYRYLRTNQDQVAVNVENTNNIST